MCGLNAFWKWLWSKYTISSYRFQSQTLTQLLSSKQEGSVVSLLPFQAQVGLLTYARILRMLAIRLEPGRIAMKLRRCRTALVFGPIPWSPLSRVVVVVVVVVVNIDAQAARDSTASDIWWIGVRRLVVANGPNILQMLLVLYCSCSRPIGLKR